MGAKQLERRFTDCRHGETLYLCEDFGCGALARSNGAFHVAVPVIRGLRACPMDPTDRLTHPGAVDQQRPHTGDPDGTSSSPLLPRPARLEEVASVERLGAEELGVLVENRQT